ETAAPEMPPPEEVPITTAPGVGQAAEAVVAEPPAVQKSRKRGHEGIDANAPPKSLRRDHADRPSGVPADVSDPDPLAFADAPSPPPANVAQSSQGIDVAEDPGSENASSSTEVSRRDKRIRELEIKNLEALLETEAETKRSAEDKNAELMRELKDVCVQFSGLKVSNEHLSQRVAAIQEQVSGEEKLKAAFEEFKWYEDDRVEQRWVIGHGLRLAMMKCAESLEMRQAFADVVSAGVAKGMSEGLKHEVEHGRAQLELESIEEYDPEAEAKFVAALQSLKDLKFSLLDQLKSLKDAPMDLTILVYPEVRDPRNLWACKEEIALADAIAVNISRAEKKKKCRIVCRTHGVGSAHHARSDGVPVSVPSVVPQGLALLLVDGATQTDPEDSLL
nr:hypothetical protein [Tanacetum cinerariifolium]